MRIRQIFSADADSFASVLARMQMQPGAPAFIVNSATDMQRVTGKAEREASGYIATIMEATQFADSLRMTGVLANSTFDPIAIRRDGASVYIVTADERLETSAPWVRLVCEVVRQRINRSPVHRQVHWVIDEAKAFDAWSFIEEGLRAMRSANISLHLFYQNVGQLKGVWGEGWTSIADTKVIRFLGSSDVETCKWIAELAGETTVVEYGVSDNTSETRGDLHARGQTAGEAHADGTSRTSNWSVAKGLSHGQSHSRALANAETWGQQRNRSRTNSLSRSEGSSFGQSHAITHGHSFQESTSTSTTHGDSLSFGAGPGGSTSNTGIHSSTTTNASSSMSESTSVTNGVNSSVSTNHGSSESDTTGESISTGASHSRTTTEGATNTTSTTDTEGKSTARTTTRTLNKGTSETQTTNASRTAGKTRNYTERRRLMTVDEVRRLDKGSMLVFIDRQPDCLVERLHYHLAAPLLARVFIGRAAATRKDDPPPDSDT